MDEFTGRTIAEMIMTETAKSIKQKSSYKWFDDAEIARAGQMSSSSLDKVAKYSMLEKVIKNGSECVYEFTKTGNVATDINDFVNAIKQLGGRHIYCSVDGKKEIHYKNNGLSFSLKHDKDGGEHYFTWDNAVCKISLDDGWTQFKILTLDKEFAINVRALAEKHIIEKKVGRVYVFASGEDGPALRQVGGIAGVELERANYTPSVLEDFDHIVGELKSKKPSGKISIMAGAPGVGKTYLIRSLTNLVGNAMFVVIPPNMVSDVMSPALIPVLIDHRNDDEPIVFIVEDADSVLVQRQADNMNSVSSMLNLGDGILGALLNLHIIATTNSKKLEIDKAILRPGRLCKFVEMDKLPSEQANRVYSRLTGIDKMMFDKPAVLAEVYALANQQYKMEISKLG